MLRAAAVNVFILTPGRVAVFNVKGAARGEEPERRLITRLCSSLQLYEVF